MSLVDEKIVIERRNPTKDGQLESLMEISQRMFQTYVIVTRKNLGSHRGYVLENANSH